MRWSRWHGGWSPCLALKLGAPGIAVYSTGPPIRPPTDGSWLPVLGHASRGLFNLKLEAGQLGQVDCGEVSATARCVALSGKDEAVTSARSACCASRESSRYLDANQPMILQCRRKSALSTLPAASAPQSEARPVVPTAVRRVTQRYAANLVLSRGPRGCMSRSCARIFDCSKQHQNFQILTKSD